MHVSCQQSVSGILCLQDAAGHKATGNSRRHLPVLWLSAFIPKAWTSSQGPDPASARTAKHERRPCKNLEKPHGPCGKDDLCQVTEEKPDTAARPVWFDTSWWLPCSCSPARQARPQVVSSCEVNRRPGYNTSDVCQDLLHEEGAAPDQGGVNPSHIPG